ncbi:hypothetical protein IC582_005680 [Cucumis melo]
MKMFELPTILSVALFTIHYIIDSSVWLWPLERIKFCTISFNFSQKNGSGFKVMAAAKSKLNSTSKCRYLIY